MTDLDPVLVNNVRNVMRLREAAGDATEFLNERIDIVLEGPGNGPFVAQKGNFSITVDEPAVRAGQDTAANPLAYFVTGAATCYLSHFMMVAIDGGTDIDGLRATARGRFNRRAVGGHLVRLVYDVRVESSAPAEAVIAVASQAEKMCYAHNTLVKAGVEVRTRVFLAGSKLVELEADTRHM